MGRRKKQPEAAQLRFVTKIHVCMCQFPYTGKKNSRVCRAVGTNGDATWLRVAHLSNCPSLYVCRRCRTIHHFGSRPAQ